MTLPEALPIAVITRFLKWFHDFGIPVGGIVVNGLLPEGDPAATPEFVKNRRQMQAEHMQTIWKLFDGDVRALVPFFETEIRGSRPCSARRRRCLPNMQNNLIDERLAALQQAKVVEILQQSAGTGIQQTLDLALSAFYFADHVIGLIEATTPLPQPIACQ